MIQAREIRITQSEMSELIGRTFTTFAEAHEALLGAGRRRAPRVVINDGMPLGKIWFTIVWSDGHEYEGRIDLLYSHLRCTSILAEHVRGFAERSAGVRAPLGRSMEDWLAELQRWERGGFHDRSHWLKLLERYQIGDAPPPGDTTSNPETQARRAKRTRRTGPRRRKA
jgi:hypothetical protein